ncbi:YfiR family protein [Chitinimonas viridis]|uniref:YfiR family protein n=1 Tax=Chitinimonas viridis TaxID=664880 RepID=A0ABT8B4F4_9NEIS|nr:YfiR family protein [Chitinimonas viridis]MDN3576541.1 YfiR family protein [Chitinimonas viridis]
MLCCLLPMVAAASDGALEYKVKAAYLYKFSSYIEWPDSAFTSPDAPLIIGVLGADAVAHELEALLAGRSSQQHPLALKRLQAGADLAGIHILFIGKREADNLKPLLQPLQTRPVLVVTESANALAAGSIINFVLHDQRVRFEIALGKAEHSGLKLSARLLAVATQVRNGTP